MSIHLIVCHSAYRQRYDNLITAANLYFLSVALDMGIARWKYSSLWRFEPFSSDFRTHKFTCSGGVASLQGECFESPEK